MDNVPNIRSRERHASENNVSALFAALQPTSTKNGKPCSVPKLCKHLGVGRSTLQRQLTYLVELGVIELITDDRTMVRVGLTELGKAMATSLEECITE